MHKSKSTIINSYKRQIEILNANSKNQIVSKTIERLKEIVKTFENDELIGIPNFLEADAAVLWNALYRTHKDKKPKLLPDEILQLIFDDFLKTLGFSSPVILCNGAREYTITTPRDTFVFRASIKKSGLLANSLDINFLREPATPKKEKTDVKTASACVPIDLVPELTNVAESANIVEIFRILDESLKYLYRNLKRTQTPSSSMADDLELAYSSVQDQSSVN